MKDFGNSMRDHDHDFSNLSIPQMSPRASKCDSQDFRFASYERMAEP